MGRRRVTRLQEQESRQSLADEQASSMADTKRLAVGPAARPVRSSTGVGQGQEFGQCHHCLDFWQL
jgi:hypothetical protein